MSRIRVVAGVVALAAMLVVWFVERDLPPRASLGDFAPSRPNFATGEVYGIKQRGGGYLYVTAEEWRARETRFRNSAIMVVSVFTIVFGVIPLYLLVTRRKDDEDLVPD